MSDADATQARQDVVADVDEIIEHVINANMLSMPYDVYSELFDAVDGLGVEIENIQAENAKLRESRAEMYQCAKAYSFENAKLRELCKAWHKFSYELFDEFIGEPEMNDEFMELDDRMQELGVEVSE